LKISTHLSNNKKILEDLNSTLPARAAVFTGISSSVCTRLYWDIAIHYLSALLR